MALIPSVSGKVISIDPSNNPHYQYEVILEGEKGGLIKGNKQRILITHDAEIPANLKIGDRVCGYAWKIGNDWEAEGLELTTEIPQ